MTAKEKEDEKLIISERSDGLSDINKKLYPLSILGKQSLGITAQNFS